MRTALLQHGGSEGGLTAGVVRVREKKYPDTQKIGQAPADRYNFFKETYFAAPPPTSTKEEEQCTS